MPVCKLCGEPGVGFAQVFVTRKKTTSYPICLRHALLALAYQEFGQDLLRSGISGVFPVKKGTIPRIKVSLKP